MGDGEKASLRLQFNPKVRLAFHGATITTDAGLLAFREFDDALGLTEIAEDYLQESRTGRNILHHLVPLLRQSIYTKRGTICFVEKGFPSERRIEPSCVSPYPPSERNRLMVSRVFLRDRSSITQGEASNMTKSRL